MTRIYMAANGLIYHPTGTCFDDTLDILSERIIDGDDPRGFTVVHALCINNSDPTRIPYTHAWLEWGDVLAIQNNRLENHEGIFETMTIAFPLHEFRERLNIQRETRYSAVEAVRMNYITNHYGPWIEEYVKHCRKEA